MQLLSAAIHAPERPGNLLCLPPLEEGGWSFSILGRGGQGVFHGEGNPRASAIFDGLLRQSGQSGCAIALTGSKLPQVRQHHFEGQNWAFASLQQAPERMLEDLLEAASEGRGQAGAVSGVIRHYLDRAPEFVLCNGRDSFVFSCGGLFAAGAVGHYDSGAHPTVYLSTTPFGDHVWERLPEGCLIHFVDGCEASRQDTGFRLNETARKAMQRDVVQNSVELAQRTSRHERLQAASWWSG
ncbi:hypothetical protein KM176_23645 [Pseudooceanicola sp. CBS1P-1]|uniref:Uncharacterized protein n=1 Tax=Pseudooceanicola albus TaxID=2692189 RepID=A0A6L7GBP7_9RHOB|nr:MULTISPECIES: hypothetical protein [Pseudooceanicola]MBT9386857.1 hypothetical protein [Pseudooceanicola endophyticus]MXN21007.1 hypothetical protein [Pseudooceanicola albus]